MKLIAKAVLPLFLSAMTGYSYGQNKPAFDGPYAGISLGYNQTSVSEGNVSWVGRSLPGVYTGSNGPNSKSGGFIGGLNFGYDHRIKNLVVGAELAGSLPGGTANGYAAMDDITPGSSQTNVPLASNTKLQSLFTFKPKLGYVFDDNKTMVYGMAGVAMGSIKRTITDNSAGANAGWWLDTGYSASNTKIQFGYVLGAGVERMITEALSLKLEFNYVDLGNPSFTYSAGPLGDGAPTMNQNVKITNVATTLGLSYKF